ncbi:MAG: deaminase [Oscillospiraceae bacterium]|nr:deaminase [Oscillospiraceae bacterium]
MPEGTKRISKHNYYLDIAQTVAERSTCLRKKYGAIIVNHDVIISTGYNGAPRGRVNCCDRDDACIRDELNIPRGERYELCRAVHSEANAIITASREEMIGSTLYMTCVDAKTNELQSDVDSCQMCKRYIINAGIKMVIIRQTASKYKEIHTRSWVINDDSLGAVGY